MRHIHSIYDTDSHFIINPITRKITSESGKVTLMQYDHLSERFTFEIPRIIEGHDMSLTDKVEVHYINSANKKDFNDGIYEVDDLQVSPDSDNMVCFSWLISGGATVHAGSLAFAVRFVCFDGTEITYQWLTDTFTAIKVNEGVYNTEAVFGEFVDVVEKWYNDLLNNVNITADNANIAVNAANRAFTSADNAQVSANNAKSSATAAMNSATNAQSSANNAAVSESSARDSANSASVSAESAANSVAIISETVNSLEFKMNFETGQLEYTSSNYSFNVNTATGNLECEVT